MKQLLSLGEQVLSWSQGPESQGQSPLQGKGTMGINSVTESHHQPMEVTEGPLVPPAVFIVSL
jgi:hypothetical protein